MNQVLYSKIKQRLKDHYYDCVDCHEDMEIILKEYKKLSDKNNKLQKKLINRVESWIRSENK